MIYGSSDNPRMTRSASERAGECGCGQPIEVIGYDATSDVALGAFCAHCGDIWITDGWPGLRYLPGWREGTWL